MLKPGDVVQFKDGRLGRVTVSVEGVLNITDSLASCNLCSREFGCCIANREGISCIENISEYCYFTMVHNYEGELQSLIYRKDKVGQERESTDMVKGGSTD